MYSNSGGREEGGERSRKEGGEGKGEGRREREERRFRSDNSNSGGRKEGITPITEQARVIVNTAHP